MKRNKIVGLVLSCLMVTALLLASCAPAAPSEGTLLVATRSLGTGMFDPHQIRSGWDFNIQWPVYEGLIQPSDEGPKAWLAEKWEVSPDGKSITFTLRKGIKFHNGDPFTAEDVKFSIERAVREDITSPRSAEIRAGILNAEVIDTYHVKVNLKKVYGEFFNRLMNYLRIAPVYFATHEDEIATQPIGTGPWKFVRREGEDKIHYEANEDYWGFKPYAKELVYIRIQDPATGWAALKAGDVNVLATITGTPFVTQAKTDPDISLVTATGANVYYMTLMLNTEEERADPSGKPLLDLKVRQALSYAIDRQGLTDRIFHGYAKPSKSYPFLPHTRGYRAGDPSLPYNPQKAKQLLAEAGYPDGFKIQLNGIATAPHTTILEAIQGYWKDIGVDAEIVVWESARFLSAGWKNFEMRGITMRRSPGSILYEPAALRFLLPGMKDIFSELWDAIEDSDRTIDPDGLNRVAGRQRDIYTNQLPIIALFEENFVYALGPGIADWKHIPLGGGLLLERLETIRLKGQPERPYEW